MSAGLIGFAIGLTVGAMTGTAGAAFGGAIVGMSIGLAIWGIQWMRAHLGDAPVIERHRVVCTPYGQLADVELEGDLETKRWTEVKRCSLLDHEVDCDEGCLATIRLGGTKPGGACNCGAHH